MRSPPDDHRYSIDMLRFAAAFGVVWAHMLLPDAWAAFGYTALSIFLILVPFLSIHAINRPDRKGQERPCGVSYLRVQRILWPWLFWCLVFKVLITYQSRDAWSFFSLKEPFSLLVGPSIHLWFLPFILIASAVLLPLSRRLDTREAVITASIGAALVSMVCVYLHDNATLPEPFGQWAFAVPPFLYGLLAAYGRKFQIDIVPALSFVGVSLLFMTLSDAPWLLFSILALPIFALVLIFERRCQAFHVLGALSFGIYLIHPIFLVAWYRVDPGGNHKMLGALAVFTLSAIATAVMRKTPFLRTVV